jgi:hypothetical protein
MIDDYWADRKDNFKSHDGAFARLTVDQIKVYKVNIDVDGIEDDGQNMYSNIYLTEMRKTHISLEPFRDTI